MSARSRLRRLPSFGADKGPVKNAEAFETVRMLDSRFREL